jgi:hypothetical protein
MTFYEVVHLYFIYFNLFFILYLGLQHFTTIFFLINLYSGAIVVHLFPYKYLHGGKINLQKSSLLLMFYSSQLQIGVSFFLARVILFFRTAIWGNNQGEILSWANSVTTLLRTQVQV